MASVLTNDRKRYTLDEGLVKKCKVIELVIEGTSDNFCPLPNVHSREMERIIEFHVTDGVLSSHDDMIDLLLACDYLNYDELLDYGARIVAESLRGKTAREIREKFNLA